MIIPVFNAVKEVELCIKSVLRHTRRKYRLIIINDASTDEKIAPLLNRFRGVATIEVYENALNMGFTATINRGLGLAGRADVVLLNSDTVVTPQLAEQP